MPLFGQNIMQYRDNYILNEAFVGKTPTLIEIEEEFEALFREKHKMSEPLSTNPHIIKINRLFEKQFNMDICAIKVVPNNVVNGYTEVIGRRFDIYKSVDLMDMVTGDVNNGYIFKGKNDFVLLIYLYYGLLFNQNLTPGEIVAIILHEIGHNFADCIYGTINYANKEMMAKYEEYIIKAGITKGLLNALLHGVTVPEYIILKKLYKDLNNAEKQKSEKKFNSKSKASHKFKALFDAIKGSAQDFDSLITTVIMKISGPTMLNRWMRLQGSSAKENAKKSVDRQNEVFADKFAAVYGYGPELVAGLAKTDFNPSKADKIIGKLPEGLRKAALEYDKAAMKLHDYDCHPQIVQRLFEELKLLQREIEKEDVDPKVKKVLSDQISQIKEVLEDITDTTKKISDNDDAIRLYNDYIKNNCPDAVDDEIENAIEDALDEIIDRSKKKGNK